MHCYNIRMNCISQGAILGRYDTSSSRVTLDLDSKFEYSSEPISSIRGKFFAILFWNPLQSLGNISLRLYYIFTGTWAHHGRIAATEAHYDACKTDFSLRGRAVSSNKIFCYQLIELAKEISKLVLFVIFEVPLREVIALFGVVFPLDGRVSYAYLERLLFVYPNDRVNSKAHWLEFFSFSAPCMQPALPEIKLNGRRCDSCCASEDRIYQPNLITVKLKVFDEKVTRLKSLCLYGKEADFFTNLVTLLYAEKERLRVSTSRELDLVNGANPRTDDERALIQISDVIRSGLTHLENYLKAWSLNESYSFGPFIMTVQKIYPKDVQ